MVCALWYINEHGNCSTILEDEKLDNCFLGRPDKALKDQNSLSKISLSSLDSIPVILINIITVLLCLLRFINLFLLSIRITYC